MIEEFQADPQRIGLLRALGDQLEYLVEHGGADIHSLLLWLKTEGLVLEEEHEELRERYALDEVSAKFLVISYADTYF